MAAEHDEDSPLLGRHDEDSNKPKVVAFDEDDKEYPRNWSKTRKMLNVAIIALMAILSPLASSMFTPGIKQIAEDLNTTVTTVVGASSGYVVLLGVGPLILAPLSETFGRRNLYLICFSVFTLLQIPTALSPNIETLIVLRTISGFFGSIGIANGGGTISDMFVPSERAGIFGWYLLGPLMGPTLGPLFGGLIVENLGWRWVFWVLAIVCTTNTLLGIFFLKETYSPVILEARCRQKQDSDSSIEYRFEGQDDRPFRTKALHSMQRPLKILFTQPIVFTMAIYQAILFGTNFSLYTNFEDIWGRSGYGYSTTDVGLMYLGFGAGFLIAVLFLIPRIDTIYNALTSRNHNIPLPEFRLPLANIGALFIPLTLFWFAWCVQYHVHWFPTILSTTFYAIGQVTIFNTVQNYYIDSFSKYAASAIAAGAVFRSLIGGVVPLFAPTLFEKLDYGWGISLFGFVSVLLSPSPLLFYYFGERLRKKFEIDL